MRCGCERESVPRRRSLSMLAAPPLRVLFLLAFAGVAWARSEPLNCTVVMQTDKGAVCGRRRVAADGSVYASFRGVPYAKQPLGELRFQELQPAEPWLDQLDATEEGPVCPQHDIFYTNLTYPHRVMSEACIHANIHVPIDALPATKCRQPVRNLAAPYEDEDKNGRGLPIVVFVHGGGFAYGSGDSDVHGPEYLVTKQVIVITFNYRLNVFGFLSLNSSYIPGNNGLRDVVTLLRWVQTNAPCFGGNPYDVTLAGQSAGAAITHLLSMTPGTDGLFHKMIIMSATASPLFYSASPIYVKMVSDLFLTSVGINATDPEEVHNQLIEMPLEKIMAANKDLQNLFGILAFTPVVETATAPDFTTIIEDDPDVMIQQGRGNERPIMIGFTTVECEIFRPIFESIDMVSRLKQNPTIAVYPKLSIQYSPEVISDIAQEIQEKYYKTINIDGYVKYCTDAFFTYPAIKLAKIRAMQRATATYLYQFSYDNDNNVLRRLKNLTYSGATHVEDQSYVFRVNTGFPKTQLHVPTADDPMVNRMSSFITNFIHCSSPTCDSTTWTPVEYDDLTYQDIQSPNLGEYRSVHMTDKQEDMYRFLYSIENRNS